MQQSWGLNSWSFLFSVIQNSRESLLFLNYISGRTQTIKHTYISIHSCEFLGVLSDAIKEIPSAERFNAIVLSLIELLYLRMLTSSSGRQSGQNMSVI